MHAPNSKPDGRQHLVVANWSREPLVYFVLVSLALFGLYGAVRSEPEPRPDTIVVDADVVNALAFDYERVWQRPPNDQELNELITGWVRDEVFYREGRAQGLDRDDNLVRRRVIQKMTLLIESSTSKEPTHDEVEQWYRKHRDRYRTEPRYTLQQIYFDPARHEHELKEVVAQAKAALTTTAQTDLGDNSTLPKTLNRATVSEVSRSFGRKFSGGLAALPVGTWSGPIPSSFGLHLVRVDAREPGGVLPLADVRSQVVGELEREQNQRALESFYAAARTHYEVQHDMPAPTRAFGSAGTGRGSSRGAAPP